MSDSFAFILVHWPPSALRPTASVKSKTLKPNAKSILSFVGGLAFSSSEIGTAILLAAAPMVVLVFLVARVRFNSPYKFA